MCARILYRIIRSPTKIMGTDLLRAATNIHHFQSRDRDMTHFFGEG